MSGKWGFRRYPGYKPQLAAWVQTPPATWVPRYRSQLHQGQGWKEDFLSKPQKKKEKQEKPSRSTNKTIVNGYKMGELVFLLPLAIRWVTGRSWLLPEKASCPPQGFFWLETYPCCLIWSPQSPHAISPGTNTVGTALLLFPGRHKRWEQQHPSSVKYLLGKYLCHPGWEDGSPPNPSSQGEQANEISSLLHRPVSSSALFCMVNIH